MHFNPIFRDYLAYISPWFIKALVDVTAGQVGLGRWGIRPGRSGNRVGRPAKYPMDPVIKVKWG